ncbi:MAG: hypothetical protein JJU45_07230 [Acidimicrobiia bacterium]|nr:hypothetical protein [Acidimicrobiia bacterium]
MDTTTFTLVIAGGTVLLALAIAVPVLWKVRKAFGPSKADVAKAQQLMATGAKARATVLAVHPTGTVVNHINIGCRVDFRLEPLDGSPAFNGSKDTFINQAQMPRMGDVWPAWYDRADPNAFMVAAPGPPTAEQLAVFREFGIAHPLEGMA